MDKSVKHGLIAGGLVILLGGPIMFINGVKATSGKAPPPAQASVGGHTVNPYQNNPNAGVAKLPDFTDLTCEDVFGDLEQMWPKSGYGTYYLKQDRTKIVGEDPNIAMKYHIMVARPGSVKHCRDRRDWSDCKCDLESLMCAGEPYHWGVTTINKGLQDPRMARHRIRRADMDAVYASFESLCRGG